SCNMASAASVCVKSKCARSRSCRRRCASAPANADSSRKRQLRRVPTIVPLMSEASRRPRRRTGTSGASGALRFRKMNKYTPDHEPDRLAGLRQWSTTQGRRVGNGARWTWAKLVAAPWKLIGIGVAGAFGVLIAALILFVTFADWNAFRGPISRLATAATGREIAITGDLHINPWSWEPQIRVKGLRIGNQARFRQRGLFANVADADASIRLLPLLFGRFEVVRLDLYDADIALYRTPTGDANWASAPEAARSTQQANMPAMRHFGLTNGHVHYVDDKLRIALDGVFTTQESSDPNNPGRFELHGDGA